MPLGAPPGRTCPGWHQLAQATIPCRSPRGTTVPTSEGRAIGGLRRGASVSMATASSSGGARRWPREMMLRTWAGPKGWAVPTGCQQRAGSPRSAATPVTTARAPQARLRLRGSVVPFAALFRLLSHARDGPLLSPWADEAPLPGDAPRHSSCVGLSLFLTAVFPSLRGMSRQLAGRSLCAWLTADRGQAAPAGAGRSGTLRRIHAVGCAPCFAKSPLFIA